MSILLCYDGSPSAKHAIQALPETVKPDDVTLLYVWPQPLACVPDSFADGNDDLSPDVPSLESLELQRAEAIVREGQRLALDCGFRTDVKLAPSGRSDWETILAIADELHSDMIVLGAHAQGQAGPTLERTSERVVQRSRTPILVVPQ